MRELTILWRFVLTYAETGEREQYLFPGQGADRADKQVTKSSTQAAEGGGRRPERRDERQVTEPQVRRLWVIARQAGVDDETVRRLVWLTSEGAERPHGRGRPRQLRPAGRRRPGLSRERGIL